MIQRDNLEARISVQPGPHYQALAEARRLIREYCSANDIPDAELIGLSRERHLVRARGAVMCALRERGYSLHTIGRLLHRDHSTVLAHTRGVKRQGAAPPQLDVLLEIEALKARVTALEERR